MTNELWGRKIGMTRVFSQDDYRATPVTVISVGQWYVLQKKNVEKDGYNAIQLGMLRKKYRKQEFSLDWIKHKKDYFLFLKEIKCVSVEQYVVGSLFEPKDVFVEGDVIKVTGTSIGKGFQGVVKRYGFTGGRASHGDKLGRHPGSLGGLRTQGMVVKGKKMPGRCGGDVKTIANMRVVGIKDDANIILLKGSVPGKSGSLVYLYKQGGAK